MLQIIRADSLIAVGSLLTMLVWLRKFPLPPTSRDDEQAAHPFVRWRVFAGFLLLLYLFTAAFAALWTWLLWLIAHDGLASEPPAVYVVKPEPFVAVWVLPGLLLGLQCGVAALDLAMIGFLGPRYYQSWTLWGRLPAPNPQALVRGRESLTLLHLFSLALILWYVALFMGWHTRFGEERVVIHDLCGFGEHAYSYDDIDKVVAVSQDRGEDGDVRIHPTIYLFFRDGRRWCDEDYGTRGPEYRGDDDKFLAFLCEKSGRPLTRVRSIEEATDDAAPRP